MRILGIDPGLNITGYGLLEINGSNFRNEPALLEAGVIKTQPNLTLAQRVNRIYKGIKEILDEFQPQVLVLEELYSHYRHPRTAILMGHARGVITLAAEEKNISLVGYSPSRIRKALLGQGNATKEQVQRMIQHLLGLSRPPQPEDISDALALALAYVHIERSAVLRKPRVRLRSPLTLSEVEGSSADKRKFYPRPSACPPRRARLAAKPRAFGETGNLRKSAFLKR